LSHPAEKRERVWNYRGRGFCCGNQAMVRIEFIRQAVQADAGEVLLNAVDRDGMMT